MPDKTLTLILGGARSGKSSRAVELARGAARVLFVATAEALDDEMAVRIAAHRRERPAHWQTLEEPRYLAASIARASTAYDLVVIDCLTLWVSNVLDGELERSTRTLIETYRRGTPSWIVVSNEVGLGIVPDNALARTYRDALGAVNRLVAAAADRVTFMAAGLSINLKG